MSSADLLLHPVRLRILQAFLGEPGLTTAHLRERLPDVAPATLYRQVATLVGGGVLEVVAERQARGAVERTYRLRLERAAVDGAEAGTLSVEEHRAAARVFLAGLLADVERYLGQPEVDVVADGFGYRQAGFYASDEEVAELVRAIRAAVEPLAGRGPGAGRTRRLLTTVLLPADPGHPPVDSSG